MQKYNLQLRKSIGCKLHNFEEHETGRQHIIACVMSALLLNIIYTHVIFLLTFMYVFIDYYFF